MKRLQDLYKELDAVNAMNDVEVCAIYNADSKQDIIDLIEEEIDSLLVDEEEGVACFAGIDPAFGSWEEVDRMFI